MAKQMGVLGASCGFFVSSLVVALFLVGPSAVRAQGLSPWDCNDNGVLDICDVSPELYPNICAEHPPLNLDIMPVHYCKDAQELELGYFYEGSTEGAPSEGYTWCGRSDTPAVWYKFTAPLEGESWQLHASLGGTACLPGGISDPVISLWSGCPADGGEELVWEGDECIGVCNDDGCECSLYKPGVHYFDSRVFYPPAPGQVIYIRISSMLCNLSEAVCDKLRTNDCGREYDAEEGRWLNEGKFLLRVDSFPDSGCSALPGGGSKDCNNNGIPDECDIASGFSLDSDKNGIPDECEEPITDCNDNGIDDVLELEGNDCNNNGIPDDCELDSDGDRVINDCDGCPFDPDKTEPGVCGCGVPDIDLDGNGIIDCLEDQFPRDCWGIPGGSAKDDRCGVCDGDGSSYLNCSSVNLTSLVKKMEDSFSVQQRYYRRTARVAKRSGCEVSRRQQKRIGAAVTGGNKALGTYPDMVQKCQNRDYCTEALLVLENESFAKSAEELFLGTRNLARCMLKGVGGGVCTRTPAECERSLKRQQASVRRRVTKARRLRNDTVSSIEAYPESRSICCDEV